MYKEIYRPTRTGSIQSPFWARSCGHYVVWNTWSDAEIRKDFFELFWGVDGIGTFESGRKMFELHPGEVFCYFPGDVHRIRASSPRWEYYWMTCDGPHIRSMLRFFGLGRMPFPAGECPVALFERLSRELGDYSSGGEYRSQATAYEILSRSRMNRFETHDLVEHFRKLTESSFRDPDFSVERAAVSLRVHRTTLMRVVKKMLAVSPVDYLISRRVQEAVSLLIETDASVKQIADSVGCRDPNYLAKMLRRRLGHSPTDFRRKKTAPE